MTADPGLDDSLFAALANRSRRTNLQRIERLTGLLQGWQHADPVDPAEHQEVVRLAHQVVGSAGTFGFETVSDLGRQLEEQLQTGAPPDVRRRAELLELATAMERGLTV